MMRIKVARNNGNIGGRFIEIDKDNESDIKSLLNNAVN